MISEDEEYQQEVVKRWTETHKKSMTMFVILVGLSQKPMWSKELMEWIVDITNWTITERGLHRTLQRTAKLGLIDYENTTSPKSGAKRKVYKITEIGKDVTKAIKDESLIYLTTPIFKELLTKS
ncbi:MAG: helix-turn-helix transcriptional regulator [Micrococcaceae bacterium]